MNNMKMLYFGRIDISERTYVNKTNTSKECDICHYWYFFYYTFKFQPNVWNRCHDLLIMPMNFRNIGTLKIEGSEYYCIISIINDNKAMNLMQNVNLTEKSRK